MGYQEQLRYLIQIGEQDRKIAARKVLDDLSTEELRDFAADYLPIAFDAEYGAYRRAQISGGGGQTANATHTVHATPSTSKGNPSRKQRAARSGGLLDTLAHFPELVGYKTIGQLTPEDTRKVADRYWQMSSTDKKMGDCYNALGAAILTGGVAVAADLGEKMVRSILTGKAKKGVRVAA